MNYGSYKLNTRYNFNEEKKNLFKGIKPSIVSSEYHLDIGRMFGNFVKHKEKCVLPALFKSDGDKKSDIETIGSFYFRNPNNYLLNAPSKLNQPRYILLMIGWLWI